MGYHFKFVDNFVNFLSGLGTGRDKRTGGSYAFTPLDRMQLEAAYRSDWVARKVVDIPAQDATRAWRNWQAKPNDIEKIEGVEKALNVQRKLKKALTLSRLYGGAAIVMGVEQGRPEEELDVDKVTRDSLKFIHVVSCWQLTTAQLIDDLLNAYHGEPAYFMRQPTGIAPVDDKGKPISQKDKRLAEMLRIHPSRVIMLKGKEVPDNMLGAGSAHAAGPGWGDSVLQAVMEAVQDTSMVSGAIATLVNEAKFDVIKIPQLSQNIATDEYRERLTKRFMYANSSKSIINSIVLDKEEEWERITTNFAGLPDVLRLYLLIASGAADIPAVRFLGQSAQGLNSTGESDIRNYYDNVNSEQNSELSPTLERLDEVLIRSATGKRDKSIFYEWNSLWQTTDTERATIAKLKADTSKIYVDTALVDQEALRIGIQNQLIEDMTYPGLEQALEEQEMLELESMVSPEEQEKAAQEAITAAQEQFNAEQDFSQQQQGQQKVTGQDSFEDSEARSLYVYRPVLNWQAIAKHYKSQGIETTLGDDMHVTIAYSRTAIDWLKAGEAYSQDQTGKLRIVPGGPRLMERLGLQREALVLSFASDALRWRNEALMSAGAGTDFATYTPHITITFNAGDDVDERKLEAWQGEIVLGPECFEEIEINWSSNVTEDALRPFVLTTKGADPPKLTSTLVRQARDAYNPRQKRDPLGTETGGQFTSTAATRAAKNTELARIRAERKQEKGGDAVADMQALADDLAKEYGVAVNVKWFEDSDLHEKSTFLAFSGGKDIHLSRTNWTPETLAKYEKEWQGLVVDASVEGIIAHEYGHHLARAIQNKDDETRKKAYEIMKKYAGIENENQAVNEAVSPYAGENLSEFVAEAFVTYHSGGKIAGDFEYYQKGRERGERMWSELLAL